MSVRQSAFPGKLHWYKGNIHSHTTLSDGTYTPERQIEAYKSHGYDFLAFSDHNVMNNKPEWNSGTLLMIPAWERDILYQYKVKCTHIIGLFPPDTETETFRRDPGDKNVMTDQMLVDEMRKENAFVCIAHPSWSRMEPDELLKLKGYDAVEVFNTGTECLCHEGHNEYIWDMLLRSGKHVLGIACDDTHSHTAHDDHFGGWIMVNSDKLDRKSIVESIQKGYYYSTMGPTINDWGMDGDSVYVECSPCSEIHFITHPARGMANFGTDMKSLTYKLKGGESYIRVEIIDEKGNRAWTNPIWL